MSKPSCRQLHNTLCFLLILLESFTCLFGVSVEAKKDIHVGLMLAEGYDIDRHLRNFIEALVLDINNDHKLLPNHNIRIMFADLTMLRMINPNAVGKRRSFSKNILELQWQSILKSFLIPNQQTSQQEGACSTPQTQFPLAILGPRSSEDMFIYDHIPLANNSISMSFSATASSISASPFVARVVPSDHYQAQCLVDAMLSLNVHHIDIIQCGDAYCKGLSKDFLYHAQHKIKAIVHEHSFRDYDATKTALDQISRRCESSRVILLSLHAQFAQDIFDAARELGILDKFFWFGSESVSALPRDVLPRGYIGIQLKTRMRRPEVLEKFEKMWKAFGRETFPGREVLLSDVMFSYTHDAVMALSLAFDAIVRAKSVMDVHSLKRELQNVAFEGISQQVAFDSNLDLRSVRYDVIAKLDFEGILSIAEWEENSKDPLFINNSQILESFSVLYDQIVNSNPSKCSSLSTSNRVAIALVAAAAAVYLFRLLLNSNDGGDGYWKIRESELEFESPVKVLGQGTFGEVLRAEYRGTTVAVKGALPKRLKDEDSSQHSSSDKMSGSSFCPPMRMLKRDSSFWEKVSSYMSLHVSASLSSSDLEPISASRLRAQFLQEMKVLSKLRHPCITTIMGAVIEEGKDPLLVTELMNFGSLNDFLHNDTVLIEPETILNILVDVSRGVTFLHSCRPPIIHGDLRSHNVLVDHNFHAKISDFGLSQKQKLGFCSPQWLAPEVLLGQKRTTASDAYAFGILLCEAYSRREPYEGEEITAILEQVADTSLPVPKRPPPPDSIPKEVRAIMEACWDNSPSLRPSFSSICSQLKALDLKDAFLSPILRSRQREQSLREGMDRTNDLLYDVLPRHIAEALKEGRKVEPEHRETVTIFFSDIVNFTVLSASLPPAKVSDMLDSLYSQLDALAKEHGVFKLETIGDAYMAVTNLVESQEEEHAVRMAAFALAAIEAAATIPMDREHPEEGSIQLRVGIHSGPVVASVVGRQRPKYTLFGDTVNTASRMESNSLPGRIQCSQGAAFASLRPRLSSPLSSPSPCN
eukprot:755698-Hanusia_phi.AAC.3